MGHTHGDQLTELLHSHDIGDEITITIDDESVTGVVDRVKTVTTVTDDPDRGEDITVRQGSDTKTVTVADVTSSADDETVITAVDGTQYQKRKVIEYTGMTVQRILSLSEHDCILPPTKPDTTTIDSDITAADIITEVR